MLGTMRLLAFPGQVKPASLGLFQAALCRGAWRVQAGGSREACGPAGLSAHLLLFPSPDSGVHLRLHRGDPHPAAAPVPSGSHVLPVPLLLPLLPDPQPVCECPPAREPPPAPRAPVPFHWGL